MLYKTTFFVVFSFLAGLSVASNAWNDSLVGFIADRGTEVVLAYKTPCPTNIAKKIPVKIRKDFSYAKYLNGAGSLNGCWMPVGEDKVVVLWEDGTKGWLYQHEFRLLRET